MNLAITHIELTCARIAISKDLQEALNSEEDHVHGFVREDYVNTLRSLILTIDMANSRYLSGESE